jgi:hypothetical protein
VYVVDMTGGIMTDNYEAAVQALRPLPPDLRIMALYESITRDREAVMQRRDQGEFLKHVSEAPRV